METFLLLSPFKKKVNCYFLVYLAVHSLASSRRRGKDVWLKWPVFHGPVGMLSHQSDCQNTNN